MKPTNDPFKFRVVNAAEGEAEIEIYGTIGADFFAMEESITAKSFRKRLNDLGTVKNITIRINSGGGSVFDAQAIYNAIHQHPAKVKVIIDGIAASAASWIAMAGDEILMAENGLFMYHLSQGFTAGDRYAHAKSIEIFDKIDGIIADIYAARTGKNRAELLEQMKTETWLTAKEAKDAGFVTGIIESKGQPTACVGPECAKLYNRAPEGVKAFYQGGAMSVHNCGCGGKGKTNATNAAQECIDAKVAEGMTVEEATAACEADTHANASQECIDAKVAEGMTPEEAAAACEAETATETPAPDNAGPAYEEGCQVAMSQGAASTNPYESGTKEWEDWQAGFESCGAGNEADNELIECPFCEGTGVCDHCDGAAVMEDGTDCPECTDGSCIVCNGTGQVDNKTKPPANKKPVKRSPVDRVLAKLQRDEVNERLRELETV